MKQIPWSEATELSLLASMFFSEKARGVVIEKIKPEAFYKQRNRVIYESIVTLVDRGDAVDAVTISNQLEGAGHLHLSGGIEYLSTIVDANVSDTAVDEYCEILNAKLLARKLIDAGRDMINNALDEEDPVGVLDQAEETLFHLSQEESSHDVVKVGDLLWDTLEEINERRLSDNKLLGVHTGFSKLDQMTAGLKDGNLIIVAGRPSMGKSALATNIMQNAALAHDIPVLLFSLEMTTGEVLIRMLSSEACIDSRLLQVGELDEDGYNRLSEASGLLRQAPIYVDDTGGLTPLELRAKSRKAKRDFNIGLIIVDYMQLMGIPDFKGNREGEVREISKALKSLARELNIPVVGISQLSRACEQRENKRPLLSDLRDSGSIEQDADVVIFVYRPEVYGVKDSEGKVELGLQKQRNGPTGIIHMTFNKPITTFEEPERQTIGEGFA